MAAVDLWVVVVVGGGPGGAVSAALLAEAGYRVVLLERTTRPRSKPCGESLNPGAVRQLARLGALPDVLGLPHSPITGWSVHPAVGPIIRGGFAEEVGGIAVGRKAFDDLLRRRAANAGASVHMGATVTDLLRDTSGVRGVRTREWGAFWGRVVIGADGLRSVVVRRLGLLRRPPQLRKIGLTAHFRDVRLEPGIGELHLRGDDAVGIVSIAPGVANVVVVHHGGGGALGERGRDAWFDETVASVPALRGARRTGPVGATGPFDWPTSAVAAEGVFLVGDAAGYFDPFTGQGIFRALVGARLAAWACDRVLRGEALTPQIEQDYGNRHRQLFTAGERVQKLIEFAAQRPIVFSAAAAGLAGIPGLADRLVALIGDVHTAERLDPLLT